MGDDDTDGASPGVGEASRDSPGGPYRRGVLGAVAAAFGVGLAGCGESTEVDLANTTDTETDATPGTPTTTEGTGTDTDTETETDTPTASLPTTVPIDPTETYLRTAPADDAGDAPAHALADLGVAPGEAVVLQRLGSYEKRGSGGEGLTAVFSGSDRLLASDRRERVPDAVDAGADYETSPTFEGDRPTDIPEDFRVSRTDGTESATAVTVPSGATHLFAAAIDTLYADNTDEDGDFRLRVRSGDTRLIESAADLAALADPDDDAFPLDGTYLLAGDLDLSGEHTPIGDRPSPFTGTFDGGGNTVRGLTVDVTGGAGLFAVLHGTVRGLTLEGVSVDGGGPTGALVGLSEGGEVRNCSAAGSVTGANLTGGLVGFDVGGTVAGSSAAVAVDGANLLGGLVGRTDGGEITGATASGAVTGEGFAGGLVGTCGEDATVAGSSASGDVTGTTTVGGLIGSTASNVTVRDCEATGGVTGRVNVGGLVGLNEGEVVGGSTAGGAVSTEPQATNVGGLVGNSTGTVRGATASGDVTAEGGSTQVGGLVGSNGGTVRASSAGGTVTDESIQSGPERGRLFGGLVGFNEGTIRESAATATVAGTLAPPPTQGPGGEIQTGEGTADTGGLVGRNAAPGTVRATVAHGDVTGDDRTGGLAGANDGELRQSYATGDLDSRGEVGGLVAVNDGTVTDGYWDVPATGLETSAGGQGLGSPDEDLPADAMTGAEAGTNMTGFDFGGTWAVVTDPADYPVLQVLR